MRRLAAMRRMLRRFTQRTTRRTPRATPHTRTVLPGTTTRPPAPRPAPDLPPAPDPAEDTVRAWLHRHTAPGGHQ